MSRPTGQKGRFITLEGIEGAGKSTQQRLLADYLGERGIPVVLTREPGGTPLSEAIRRFLLDPDQTGMGEDTELLLLFAARADHVARVIRPALEAGTWVLCDRFLDSTYAYQGGGRGVPWDRIARCEAVLSDLPRPDLTLLLDLPISLGLERAGRASAPDRFESESHAFFQRVRHTYLDRGRREPQRIRILDGTPPETQVWDSVIRAVQPLIP